MLLERLDSRIQVGSFGDYLVAKALELIHEELISLPVNLRLDLVQVFEESLLPIDDGRLASFFFNLLTELFDLFGQFVALSHQILDLVVEVCLHLVDGFVNLVQLFLRDALVALLLFLIFAVNLRRLRLRFELSGRFRSLDYSDGWCYDFLANHCRVL